MKETIEGKQTILPLGQRGNHLEWKSFIETENQNKFHLENKKPKELEFRNKILNELDFGIKEKLSNS